MVIPQIYKVLILDSHLADSNVLVSKQIEFLPPQTKHISLIPRPQRVSSCQSFFGLSQICLHFYISSAMINVPVRMLHRGLTSLCSRLLVHFNKLWDLVGPPRAIPIYLPSNMSKRRSKIRFQNPFLTLLIYFAVRAVTLLSKVEAKLLWQLII